MERDYGLGDGPVMKRCRFLSGSEENGRKMKKNSKLLLLCLPDELVIEILEWLPVKSLVRFKCVAKHWSTVFKSRAFIQNHRRKQGSKATMLLIRRCLPPPDFDCKEDLLSFHNLDSPEILVRDSLSITSFKHLTGHDRIPGAVSLIGSQNGIVCIKYMREFILYNPALRELKLLPRCPQGCRGTWVAVGFGLASCGHDFKVVVMHKVFTQTYVQGKPYSYLPSVIMVHLYSSKSNSWKQLDDAPLLPDLRLIEDVVFLNGAYHWPARTFADDNRMLLSLDINSEVFRLLELPDSLCRLDIATSLSPIVMNECLGLIQYSKGNPICVWVMKEYGIKESWTTMLVISPQPCAGVFLPWKNDIFILQEPRFGLTGVENLRLGYDTLDEQFNGQLTSISMHTNEQRNFQVYGLEYTLRALIHEESLVSLN